MKNATTLATCRSADDLRPRASVLDCGSLLPPFPGPHRTATRPESAGGPAHSKTSRTFATRSAPPRLRGLLALVFLLLAAVNAPAQLVNDGEANVLDGVTTNISGNVTVGTDGSFTLLVLTNGAYLTNSGAGSVGQSFGANSNAVSLNGAGTHWWVASNLTIGQTGAHNTLQITGGSGMHNSLGTIGANSNACHNLAIVDGSNSIWTNRASLRIGGAGSFNTLLITNSGMVGSSAGQIGFNVEGDSNAVVVTGLDSVWINSGRVSVGYRGFHNRLLIADGGRVTSVEGRIGDNPDLEFGRAAQNFVTVSGPGSAWNVSNNLHVGSSGPSNSLFIVNGGSVTASNVIVGQRAFYTFANRLTVDGGTLHATNENRTGTLDVREGTNQLNAGVIEADLLEVRNLSGSFDFNGGTLITRGGTNIRGPGFFEVGLSSGFAPATWEVRSNAASTVVNGTLVIGKGAANARLLVTNGASLICSHGFIGRLTGADNNAAIVSDSNSVWTVAQWIHIGENGSSNRLVISNGGMVSATNVTLGFESGSVANRVIVEGGRLRVTNAEGAAVLDIRRGTNVLNAAGVIEANRLLMTNALGNFEFNGGTIEVQSSVVANGSVFTVGDGDGGAIHRLSGSTSDFHSFADGLLINLNATLAGNGTILGNVTNFGTIAPGTSAGAMAVSGSVAMGSGAHAVFEIGGIGPTTGHDVLNVSGAVALAGQLDLSLIRSFYPAGNAAFEIMTFGSESGQFANVTNGQRVATTDGLGSFVVTVSGTNVVLSDYFSPDTNTNGIPDYGDYLATLDSDGDGQSDYAEALAGTDPNDAASVLAFTSITASGNIVVQFRSVAGKTYSIEHSADLGPWNIATTNVPATGTNTTWIDDGSLTGGLPAAQRFYRVGLQ